MKALKTCCDQENSMEFTIAYKNGIFILATSQSADPETFKEMLETLVTHKDWAPGLPFLIDHSELDTSTLSSNDMRTLSSYNALYSDQIGCSKCAIVCTKDIDYGMGRIWEVFVDNQWKAEERLFRSYREALEWLHG
jgi:hypothetical protein